MEQKDLSQLAVDLLLTWRCNLRCKKCCVPKTGPEASLSEFEQALDKLYLAGLRRVVLTGGDPLVRDEVRPIARYAKQRGFDLYLSTNGVLLQEKWPELSPYLSWASISLDAPTAAINEDLIGEGGAHQFEKILAFFRYYAAQTNQPVRIKLATVITRNTIGHLLELGKVIFSEQPGYRPDIWRLYQYSDQFSDDPNASNLSYLNSQSVSSAESQEIINQIRNRFPQVNVSYRPSESRDQAFIFIRPDLVFTYPKGKEYISFGDIKTMSPQQIVQALYSVEHLWTKIIQNRQIYSAAAVSAPAAA